MTPQTEKKLSKVEGIKINSHGLEGTIKETFENPDKETFDPQDIDVLKSHGSYQQDNRDVRKERMKQKLGKDWIYMVRAKIPGGRMTAEQFLGFNELTRSVGNSTLRITSRQGIQFHHVRKPSLKEIISKINEVGLSTLGACGDVNRNVMTCPVADLDWRRQLGMNELCDYLAEHYAPKSTAYWEIWCDGEKHGVKVTPSREEPIYGQSYMPRKFKMGVAAPEDNCVHIYTQDIGVEVVHEDGRLVGYNLLVGGGMGYTHNKPQTYSRLGSRLVRATPDQVREAIEGIFTIQRDFGDRENRKHARLKYLVDDRGEDWMREELFRRIGYELPQADPAPEYEVQDHLGWNDAVDGSQFLGIFIENGRIQDTDQAAQLTGLCEIVRRYGCGVRLTPQQNVILTGLQESDRPEVEKIMDDHGLTTDSGVTTLRQKSEACVALPTCGLALAESERYLPHLISELEEQGWKDVPVEIKMSGCPNSCVRTRIGEIGITGKAPGKYVVYVGGRHDGTRLAYTLKEMVDDKDLSPMIDRLFSAWKDETKYERSFGDWAQERGKENLVGIVENGNGSH